MAFDQDLTISPSPSHGNYHSTLSFYVFDSFRIHR